MEFNRRPSSTLAFTLIELLVVIGVIAVLLALLVPGSFSVLKKVAATKCLANLRQIGVTHTIYASENGGRCVPAYITGDRIWFEFLQEAGLDPKNLLCPAVDRKKPPILYVQGRCDYTYNSALARLKMTDPIDGSPDALGQSRVFPGIPAPSKVYLAADGKAQCYGLSASRMDFRHPGGTAKPDGSSSWYLIPDPPGTGNVVFVDGHVEALSYAPDPPDYRSLPYDPAGIPFSPPAP